ncbi:hypothetical protein [Pseudomonas sp. IAC-BECa141]|uniref:hypothetical protein n=1 Tax=Pseudomonas sp. IAC-BECa141 TaxID=2793103 RepID=UPI001D06DECE|nr:hypothetical protein [Pseudomonas sp. IAC-BECa141]UDI90603.1 hypothetical protein I5961_15630 [Pseudomonas sp. IAC-BECa141]
MEKMSGKNLKLRLVERVEGVIESANKRVSIGVGGRDVIIVGANGSGKTSFLRGVFHALKANIVDEHLFKKDSYASNMIGAKRLIDNQPESPNMDAYKQTYASNKKKLESLTFPFDLSFNDPKSFSELYNSKMAVISLFEADRKAAIKKVTSATGRLDNIPDQNNYGVDLEQHLVNLEVRSGLAMRKGDAERVKKISDWFEDFTKNLQYLLKMSFYI